MSLSNEQPGAEPNCRLCTIRLEELCYRRAWWFRVFRQALAAGVRLFALATGVPADEGKARSRMCHGCLRFSKNALKRRSRLFCWLDGYLNPLFNRARDSLLTREELERARALALRAADPSFELPSIGPSLAVLPPEGAKY